MDNRVYGIELREEFQELPMCHLVVNALRDGRKPVGISKDVVLLQADDMDTSVCQRPVNGACTGKQIDIELTMCQLFRGGKRHVLYSATYMGVVVYDNDVFQHDGMEVSF